MKKIKTKLVHEGQFIAEVPIEVEDIDRPWAPWVTVDEARKLDEVRLALRQNDIEAAGQYGKIYRVTQVAG
ncbi:MAG: hypothetical protein WD492_06585 [Alkalispirochaeta sp.]